MQRICRALFLFFGCLFPAFLHSSTAQYADAEEPNLPPVLLQIVRDPVIHEEIKVTSEQVAALLNVTDSFDGRWISSRNLSNVDQQRIVRELTEQLNRALESILLTEQRERLRQLEWQGLGTRALLVSELMERLRIDPGSRARMRAFAMETDAVVKNLEASWSNGEQVAELAEKLRRAQEREQKGILGCLAPSQLKAFEEARGKPFDFTRLRRTNPRAPEFVASAKEFWMCGEPRVMEELRGKIVVLHFFSDQFAGCRENLPSYSAWQKDFGDAGVVVVGILTPFEGDQRDSTKVRADLEALGISYPVLFDPEWMNWNAWGNQTWPTVYLIDHEGFVKNFWEGELGFEGAEGDKEFRKWIQEAIENRSK